jgi:hypothetical protein
MTDNSILCEYFIRYVRRLDILETVSDEETDSIQQIAFPIDLGKSVECFLAARPRARSVEGFLSFVPKESRG